MARWVMHEQAIEEINAESAIRDIAEAVAADARVLANKGKTLGLSSGISVEDVTDRGAKIVSTARNPRSSPEHAAYPFFVEKGTRRSRAQPYLRPAAYKYRAL